MWEVLCGRVSKIFLCEGGDVELGARISKYILVFAFDPLSLTLSLILCIASYCSYHIYACVDCVCFTCVKPRELHIAPQLLFRGDSLEPFTGNSATLFDYTKCVAISF